MDNISITFYETLKKAQDGLPLSKDDLLCLLGAKGAEREFLYKAARERRNERFGCKVFAYGFVYFSTYCRNNCAFCFYRRENSLAPRYRKPLDDVLRTCRELAASGVHLLDLTMGEDPYYFDSACGLDDVIGIAESIKRETGLPVMISPGVLPDKSILGLKKAGIDWYALYQETHNKELFKQLRLGQSFEARLSSRKQAATSGILVEDGILVGVGETPGDIADSILAMRAMMPAQVRVMSYVPQDGAPLPWSRVGELYERELNTIAAMRLAMPDRLIPASLDVAGKAGLKERLCAGANVITSLISPQSGMAGVSNATLDVENGGRSLPGVYDTVAECGLAIASQAEYEAAMKALRTECGKACGF